LFRIKADLAGTKTKEIKCNVFKIQYPEKLHHKANGYAEEIVRNAILKSI